MYEVCETQEKLFEGWSKMVSAFLWIRAEHRRPPCPPWSSCGSWCTLTATDPSPAPKQKRKAIGFPPRQLQYFNLFLQLRSKAVTRSSQSRILNWLVTRSSQWRIMHWQVTKSSQWRIMHWQVTRPSQWRILHWLVTRSSQWSILHSLLVDLAKYTE